jgi:hypothetical protein
VCVLSGERQRVMGLDCRSRRPVGGVTREPYGFSGTIRDRVRPAGNGITPTVKPWIVEGCVSARSA